MISQNTIGMQASVKSQGERFPNQQCIDIDVKNHLRTYAWVLSINLPLFTLNLYYTLNMTGTITTALLAVISIVGITTALSTLGGGSLERTVLRKIQQQLSSFVSA